MNNKKNLNELIRERFSEIHRIEKIINPDNLIYYYKTEGRTTKDFRNYQHLIDLFKNLRDGNVNPKEVTKIKLF